MELPRIASHTSISPTNIELLNYNHNTVSSSGSGDDTELLLLKPARAIPASRRPLSACITDYGSSASAGGGGGAAAAATGGGGPTAPVNIPTFTIIPGVGAAFQPSRKREEACAIQNLKRRVQQLRLLKANQQEPIECNINARDRDNNAQDLDNRPQLFQKIISNRPVSMVLDSAELRTAWQDSDFITDCLCWHNVYRQRHSAPPLTMSTQPVNVTPLDNDTLAELICRDCNDFLNVKPIMVFPNGESICGRCYKPDDYTDDNRPVHNKLYESLSDFVPFPCKFRQDGCEEHRSGKLLKIHEKLCPYRPYNCPNSSCDWNGKVRSLQEHFEINHPNSYVANHKISFDVSRDYEEFKFITEKKMQFIMQVKCEISTGKLWCVVECVTTPKCSVSYNFELKFKVSENTSSIILKNQVSSSSQPINDNDKALKIDIDSFQKLLNTPNIQEFEAHITFSFSEKNKLPETALLKEFECPICNHYMLSPIFLCSNGHSVCHSCRPQIKNCAICRVELGNLRNHSLENIILQMTYPCKNSINGCLYILPSSEIENHEKICTCQDNSTPTV